MPLSLYEIRKFTGVLGRPKLYYVFAENGVDSFKKCSLVQNRLDEVCEVCGTDMIYNIGALFNEITRLGGEGVCVACGAPVGENGTFVGTFDR